MDLAEKILSDTNEELLFVVAQLDKADEARTVAITRAAMGIKNTLDAYKKEVEKIK